MKEENNIVNLNKFKETRSITQAERAQRIMEWKVDTLVVTNIRENDELTDFLDSHPASERWIIEMYRLVFLVLNDLPEYRRDIIRMKYGLDDGIFRANATVGENIGYIDIDGHWYTCNAARVALELYEGMEHLKSISAQFEGFRSLVAQVLN